MSMLHHRATIRWSYIFMYDPLLQP